MSKPVLLSGGNGKVSELAGTESRQVLTWSQTGEEWAPGPGVGGSGGGGELFYLNALTSPDSPVVNIPTGASGTTVKELGTSTNGTGSTVSSTSSVPVSPAAPEIIAGFVTDLSVPNTTEIPAGLWEFNVWAEATGNTTNQSFIQAKVYKYNGVNAPTAIATSAEIYLYDPGDVTQYTLSALIPGGVTLFETDRIYVEILGGSTTSNRQITLSFGNSTPSHVHTTLFIPINLGTDVTGTLPVANGGTGVVSASANTVFAGPTTGSADAPSFRSLVANDIPSLSGVYLPLTGGTLTGKLNTVVSATGGAGLNLPHGVAPTSPVNGDVWTTTSGLFVQINSTSRQVGTLATAQTWSGNNTFTSTAAFTAGSNSFGTSTATGTTSLATGATISGSTKTVNIGTGGLSGSTTTIAVGATAGTSTTTLNGTTNATTASAGTNTTQVATTAFVTTAVATAAGTPYDVAGEYVGKPPVSTVLMRFIANRSWTLKSSLVQASCTAFPTGSNAVATISVAGANITSGTITWTTGSTVTVGSFADTTITSGQAVVLTVTTADSSNVFENPFFTLGGVVA